MQAEAVKIRKETTRYIESEIASYHETRKEMIRLRSEIMYSRPIDENTGGSRSSLPSKPTERTVIALRSNKRLYHLEQVVEAIEDIYNTLPNEQKRLINLCYWTKPQPLTWEGIARQLNCNRATAFRWRDAIIQAIAEKMGIA